LTISLSDLVKLLRLGIGRAHRGLNSTFRPGDDGDAPEQAEAMRRTAGLKTSSSREECAALMLY
jgi:hypothetical protein